MIKTPNLLARRVSLFFAAIAIIWIVLTTTLVAGLAPDAQTIKHFEIYKELAFIFVTALLLFYFVRSQTKKLETASTSNQEPEEALRPVLRHARTIVMRYVIEAPKGWEKHGVEWAAANFRWKAELYDETTAQEVLPVNIPPGEGYDFGWRLAKHRDDLEPMGLTAHRALLAGAANWKQEFRCIDRQGQLHWFDQTASIEPDGHGRWRVTTFSTDITGRKQAEETLRASMARLLRQESGLVSLGKKALLPDGDLITALQRITEVSARTLDAARVSVWRYSQDRSAIHCADLYDLQANRHSTGAKLAVADYPAYFQALAERDVIAADDACSDPQTREFTTSYLTPLGITSMLDAPIQLNGTLNGVVCHEHVGPKRQWTSDERTFAIAVANSVSLALEEWERRQAEKAFRQSQQAYAALVNTVDGIVWEADARTFQFSFVSQMAERLLGYPVKDWLSDPGFWRDHVHPDDRDWAVNYCIESTRNKKDHDFRYRMIAADGRVVWLHDRVSVVVQSDQPVKLRGIMVDITSLKQSEERLRASEQRLNEAQHLARIGSWIWQPDGNLIWSETMFHLFGIPPDVAPTFELFLAVVHPDEREQVRAGFEEWVNSGPVHTEVEYRLLLPDASIRTVVAIGNLERDPDGRVIHAVGTCQDITERKQAEEDLRWRTALFEAQMDSSIDGVLVVDSRGKKILQNRRMNEVWKIPPDIAEDKNDAAQVKFAASRTKNPRQFVEKVAHLYAHPDEASQDELDLVDGTILDRYSAPIRDKTGKHYGRIWFFRDITERKRAEEKLAREQARFKLIFDTIPIGIAFHTVHPDGSFTRSINEAHLRICGLTQDQHNLPDIYRQISHPDDLAMQRQFMLQVKAGTIKQFSLEKRYHHRDGKIVWVNFSYQRETYPDGTIEELTTVVDITGRKQLEEQLRQSQKMEAIGQLAGGVAHDFNNILAVIQMQAGMMRLEPSPAPAQLEYADEIENAAQRGANLTRQLLMFGRRQPLKPHDLDLNEVITNITKMLQRILGEDIQMQLKYAPQPLFVHADTGMMDQVLINLAVNSRDAMPRGGRLIVETAVVEFDAITAGQSPQARPGSFACLSVSDTGGGIPPEILPRIFEPFFTTKDVGKGTGLGLATVFGIVQQHQGWIDVYSNVGHGTTFRIYLPRLSRDSKPDNSNPALTALRGGHETILLVEDDASLRNVARNILSQLGYRVLEASTGASALTLWKQNCDEIDLLFTDMVMPEGMSGKELAQQLLQENPRLKVIYASGYSHDIAGKDVHLEEGVNFLTKPYSAYKFAQMIRAHLDRN